MSINDQEISIANLNWGFHFARSLESFGMKKIFFSPGSRSTPLIIGIERHSNIELIPVLDERSCAFLALGTSKREGIPTGVICTSGSALTHWFPAITEACHSSTPLLLFSADRPPELQDCAAGQTINQKNLFGNFVRAFHQVEIPQNDESAKNQFIRTLFLAYRQTTGINPGPVHLNFPFREPFLSDSSGVHSYMDEIIENESTKELTYPDSTDEVSKHWENSDRPLIIAGQNIEPDDLLPYLGDKQIPIICDSLSQIRHTGTKLSILHYENLLRDSRFASIAIPDVILTLGPLPTSKTLRKWIDSTGAFRIIVEPRGINVDPLTSSSKNFQIGYHQIRELRVPIPEPRWGEIWEIAENEVDATLTERFSKITTLFEGKLAHLLSLHLPENAQLFTTNSMPIRDLEWFWSKMPSDRRLFGNRGVNGIDGSLGTALGIAQDSRKPNYMLCGDLAFLHDSNALLHNSHFKGNLTIFVVNNFGGGIFQHLPIAKEAEFEKCFATPQKFNLGKLCESFHISHELLDDWDSITERIIKPIQSGIRVIEIQTNRKKDKVFREDLLGIGPTTYA